MRIALHSPRSTYLEPALAHGGDPVFLGALLAALRERGHDVEVVSRTDVRQLWRRRLPARRFVAEAVAVTRRMRRFEPDAWLVYHPSPTYPDLFGWWQRCPRYVVFAAHTWRSKRLPRGWQRLLALAFARSIARADAMIALRPATAERLRAWGAPADRVHVHPHAVAIPRNVPPQDDARRRLGLPLDAAVLLCATRFTGPEDEHRGGKAKMISRLIRLVSALPGSAVLVLVGDGPGRPRIEAEAASLALTGRVRIFGAVPNAELGVFHAASDLYVYPHPDDRTWMSVLESQAHGRPVVTMRTPSGEMTVDDGASGLLADDLEEFREMVSRLVRERERCAAMGREARRFIERTHAIDVRAAQLEALLA
jgi:glycosyltransferase involved in cell wall biosynthesis